MAFQAQLILALQISPTLFYNLRYYQPTHPPIPSFAQLISMTQLQSKVRSHHMQHHFQKVYTTLLLGLSLSPFEM